MILPPGLDDVSFDKIDLAVLNGDNSSIFLVVCKNHLLGELTLTSRIRPGLNHQNVCCPLSFFC
jgi:hypothetical protein